MTDQVCSNLFSDTVVDRSEECLEILAETSHVRIERIISGGQASPEGFWYDQVMAEWVVLLKGEAGLLFEGDHEPIHMKPGDHVRIPAHRKHRIVWTLPHEATVWLAVHYGDRP